MIRVVENRKSGRKARVAALMLVYQRNLFSRAKFVAVPEFLRGDRCRFHPNTSWMELCIARVPGGPAGFRKEVGNPRQIV